MKAPSSERMTVRRAFRALATLICLTVTREKGSYALRIGYLLCWTLAGPNQDGAFAQVIKSDTAHPVRPIRVISALDNPIKCLCVSANGKLVAASGEERGLVLFRTEETAPPLLLRGHTDRIRSLAFTNDSKLLFSSSWDRTARRWEVDGGLERSWFRSEPSLSVAVAGGDKTLVIGHDRYVRFIGLENEETIRDEHINGSARLLRFSTDGQTLAVVNHSRWIWLLKPPGGISRKIDSGHQSLITDARFIDKGSSFVTASLDHHVKVWSTDTGQLKKDLHQFDPEGCLDRVYAVGYDESGGTLLAFSHDNAVRFWNVDAGNIVRRLEIDMQGYNMPPVGAACFSPSNENLIVGSDSGRVLVFKINRDR
jgi:WD40 repeat protein